MNRWINFTLLNIFILQMATLFGQGSNSVNLNYKIYDEGICLPMKDIYFHKANQFQASKPLSHADFYYNRIYVEVKTKDTSDLKAGVNHQLKQSFLKLNPKLEYEIVIYRYTESTSSDPEIMKINISNLTQDAQVIIPFKKGYFELKDLKYLKQIDQNVPHDFNFKGIDELTNNLKLDSTVYFSNGKKKANYFILTSAYPIFYVQEYDSINSKIKAQGFQLLQDLQNSPNNMNWNIKGVWSNLEDTKYGYWDYFENDTLLKLELWTSVLKERFEWYSRGQLKSESYFEPSNEKLKRAIYHKNGAVKEEFIMNSETKELQIKTYGYSSEGSLILCNTFKSKNGIIKQELIKRALFYPSGKLKMEENLGKTYAIKYYKEDGTERNK